jgi:hypothetical protein
MLLPIRKEKNMEKEEEIRKIAYQLWEQDGCVNGRDCEHWEKAEQIWQGKQQRQSVTGAKRSASKSIFGKKKSEY